MIKLTNKNYHQKNGAYLSASKLRDYLVSPWLYHQKHVLKTLEDEKTDALILGSMVDLYVTRGKTAFKRAFKPVARRDKDDPKQVTTAMYQEAVSIAERVINTSAFKELENFERQVVLVDNDLMLCGMLDFLRVRGERAEIVDLKTARTTDKMKYFYHAIEFGYFIQSAVYVMLVRKNYPQVKEVDFYHLVVGKENKNFYTVKTFQFDQTYIERHIKDVERLIGEIRTRKDWSLPDATFDGAERLGLFAQQVTEEWHVEEVD